MGVSGENSQNISLVIRRLSRIGRNPINSFKPYMIVQFNEIGLTVYAFICVISGTWEHLEHFPPTFSTSLFHVRFLFFLTLPTQFFYFKNPSILPTLTRENSLLPLFRLDLDIFLTNTFKQ